MSKISDKEIADAIESLKYKKEYSGIAREALMVLEAAQEEISKLWEERNWMLEEIKKLRTERWEYEKGMAKALGDLSKAQKTLEWYATEEIYICGRYEGGVFFSRAEDDKGQRARKVIADIEKGAEGK